MTRLLDKGMEVTLITWQHSLLLGQNLKTAV